VDFAFTPSWISPAGTSIIPVARGALGFRKIGGKIGDRSSMGNASTLMFCLDHLSILS
jgi:hypothetical protein